MKIAIPRALHVSFMVFVIPVTLKGCAALSAMNCSCNLTCFGPGSQKMSEMQMYSETLRVSMERGPDIANITPLLSAMLQSERITSGVMHVFVVGSTASLTTIECEPGAVDDLKRAIIRLAPPEDHYEHEKAWHDGNGHSHVQAALLGPSVSVPIRNGKLATGTWQQVVLINHDVRPRERRVEVTVIGARRV